ncbi:hypothetical protein [Actinomycetospora cinnamomea]|uniref:Uncharacterized protein n=1 Tax=Actinomycetospora cinnamomea TaxID=663609 RepID=A0A2U1ECU9_9PSEU|nr:hypothetical protein [Actinomycetospora cinnamomea]PVY97692.1 hypothetical protein C8D89_1235 [Actinomycetospora cinnamomea]
MSMAVVMSEMPDVWRKVLAEHVPDAQQNCCACFHAGGRASWPCQTYRIAQEAKWVAEGGLPGTGPHGPGPSRTRLSAPEPLPGDEPVGRHGARSRHPDPLAASPSLPATGGWAAPSGTGRAEQHWPGEPGTVTGERPYGSTFDAPYGASFGVEDRPHAAQW